MARRPVYIPAREDRPLVYEGLVHTLDLEFIWHSGFAISQKQRSIESLHQAARLAGVTPLLEISSKSPQKIGVQLSAFNLPLRLMGGPRRMVENIFQGSKRFEKGGPFTDLFEVSPLEAKRDPRLRESGELQAFELDGQVFPLEPKTCFYDWLYLNALLQNPELRRPLLQFAGFTDIEFNPARSLNSQAKTAALFVALHHHGLMDNVQQAESYLEMVRAFTPSTSQLELFT